VRQKISAQQNQQKDAERWVVGKKRFTRKEEKRTTSRGKDRRESSRQREAAEHRRGRVYEGVVAQYMGYDLRR